MDYTDTPRVSISSRIDDTYHALVSSSLPPLTRSQFSIEFFDLVQFWPVVREARSCAAAVAILSGIC